MLQSTVTGCIDMVHGAAQRRDKRPFGEGKALRLNELVRWAFNTNIHRRFIKHLLENNNCSVNRNRCFLCTLIIFCQCYRDSTSCAQVLELKSFQRSASAIKHIVGIAANRITNRNNRVLASSDILYKRLPGNSEGMFGMT